MKNTGKISSITKKESSASTGATPTAKAKGGKNGAADDPTPRLDLRSQTRMSSSKGPILQPC